MGDFRDRPTPDLVVAWMAAVVGFVVVVTVIGSIIWVIVDPEQADTGVLAARVADITNTLIGAIVGYLAGRGVGTDGQSPKPPPPEG